MIEKLSVMKASQKSTINIIAFALILLIASFLRLYRLSSNPVSLNQDEAVNGYDAYSLMMTMRDHHGNFMPIMLESFDDWVSPAITYLTIPFVKVFGLSEFSIRLPIALLGTATVVLIYILTVQLFNSKRLGLLAAFLLAIMPWHITFSRWAIPPSIVPFFLLLFVSTFLWAVRQDQGDYKIIGDKYDFFEEKSGEASDRLGELYRFCSSNLYHYAF